MHPQQIAEREGKGLLISFFIVLMVIVVSLSLAVWGVGKVIKKIGNKDTEHPYKYYISFSTSNPETQSALQNRSVETAYKYPLDTYEKIYAAQKDIEKFLLADEKKDVKVLIFGIVPVKEKP